MGKIESEIFIPRLARFRCNCSFKTQMGGHCYQMLKFCFVSINYSELFNYGISLGLYYTGWLMNQMLDTGYQQF